MATFDNLFRALAESPQLHARHTAFYELCKDAARGIVVSNFASDSEDAHEFGPFGAISLPYTKMGAIDSLDLFGLDELIIFAFYYANRGRYRNVLDIGANIGLHSIILSRCGFTVRAFEPDPWHFGLLGKNVRANGARTVELNEAAVSVQDGQAQFVRVLGNTTGSHLAGSKDSYGAKETFTVAIRAIRPLLEWADLAKIDAEGHEKELLLQVGPQELRRLDIMVEIGNPPNAKAVYEHFSGIGAGMYSQKLGWGRVRELADIPTSHREGSLFISAKPQMPWKSAI